MFQWRALDFFVCVCVYEVTHTFLFLIFHKGERHKSNGWGRLILGKAWLIAFQKLKWVSKWEMRSISNRASKTPNLLLEGVDPTCKLASYAN